MTKKLQAVFTTNNGYDSVYVWDGTFLKVDSVVMKDFAVAETAGDDFSDWHGEEWWNDLAETMEAAIKETGDVVVAKYEDGKLVIVDEDKWNERKDFYGHE